MCKQHYTYVSKHTDCVEPTLSVKSKGAGAPRALSDVCLDGGGGGCRRVPNTAAENVQIGTRPHLHFSTVHRVFSSINSATTYTHPSYSANVTLYVAGSC